MMRVAVLCAEGAIDELRAAGDLGGARVVAAAVAAAASAGMDDSVPTLPSIAARRRGANDASDAAGGAGEFVSTRFGPRLRRGLTDGRRQRGGGRHEPGAVAPPSPAEWAAAAAASGLLSWAVSAARLPASAVSLVWSPLATVPRGAALAPGGRFVDAEDLDETGERAEAEAAATASSLPALRGAALSLPCSLARRFGWARALQLRAVSVAIASLGVGAASLTPSLLGPLMRGAASAAAAGGGAGSTPAPGGGQTGSGAAAEGGGIFADAHRGSADGSSVVALASAATLRVLADAIAAEPAATASVRLPPQHSVPRSALCEAPSPASLIALHIDVIAERLCVDLTTNARLSSASRAASWALAALSAEADARTAVGPVSDLARALLAALETERTDSAFGARAVPALLGALAQVAYSLGDAAARGAALRIYQRGRGGAAAPLAIEGGEAGDHARSSGASAAASPDPDAAGWSGATPADAVLRSARVRTTRAAKRVDPVSGRDEGVWGDFASWRALEARSGGFATLSLSSRPSPAPSSRVRRVVALILHRTRQHVGSHVPAVAGAALRVAVAGAATLGSLPGLVNPVLFRITPQLLARLTAPFAPEMREVAAAALAELAGTAAAGDFLRLRFTEAALPGLVASLAEDLHWLRPAQAAWSGAKRGGAAAGGGAPSARTRLEIGTAEGAARKSVAETLADEVRRGSDRGGDAPSAGAPAARAAPPPPQAPRQAGLSSLGRYGRLQLAVLQALQQLCRPVFVHDDPGRGSEDDYKGPGEPDLAPDRVDDRGRVWKAMKARQERRRGAAAGSTGAEGAAGEEGAQPDQAQAADAGDTPRTPEGSVSEGRLAPSMLLPHVWQLLVMASAFLHDESPPPLQRAAGALVARLAKDVDGHAVWAFLARVGPVRAIVPPHSALRPAPEQASRPLYGEPPAGTAAGSATTAAPAAGSPAALAEGTPAAAGPDASDAAVVAARDRGASVAPARGQAAGEAAAPRSMLTGWLLDAAAPLVELPSVVMGPPCGREGPLPSSKPAATAELRLRRSAAAAVSVADAVNPVPSNLELTAGQIDALAHAASAGTEASARGSATGSGPERSTVLQLRPAPDRRGPAGEQDDRLVLAAGLRGAAAPWKLPAEALPEGAGAAALVTREAMARVRVPGLPLRGAEAAMVALHAAPASLRPRADHAPGRTLPSGSMSAARVMLAALRETSHNEEPSTAPGAGTPGALVSTSVNAAAFTQLEPAPSLQVSSAGIGARVAGLLRCGNVWAGLQVAVASQRSLLG